MVGYHWPIGARPGVLRRGNLLAAHRGVARRARALGEGQGRMDGVGGRACGDMGTRLGIRRGHPGRRVRRRRGAGAWRVDRLLCPGDRAQRRLRRRSHSGDDRRRHCGAAAAVHLLPGRQVAALRRARHERQPRAGSRRRAPVHCRHLVPRLLRGRRALWCRGQLGTARRHCRRALDAARSRPGPRRAARRPALFRAAQSDVDPADHHAAVRDRDRARRAVRTDRAHHRMAERWVGHSAHALDLRTPRRDAGAAPRVLAHRLHDPARCAGRGEPRARRGRANPSCVTVARVSHGHLAALAARARQCVPAGVRREPRRFRQPDRARRQLRSALDQDLLRHRRRAARPWPRRSARGGAPRFHHRRVLAAAALARQALVRDGQRQGRRRHRGATAARTVVRVLRRSPRCGSSSPSSAMSSS